MSWRDIEEFAVNSLILLAGMAIGWTVVVVGLGVLGVL